MVKRRFILHYGLTAQIRTSSATALNGCVVSPVVLGSSSNCSSLEFQLHWRLCRRSWCASDWREAFESQPSAVFLGESRWRGSSSLVGRWKHAQTKITRWMDQGPWNRRAAALKASAAGGELARCGRIAECPSPAEPLSTLGLMTWATGNPK